MRWMIVWDTAPEGMREFIRLEMKGLTPIPKGVKFFPELEFYAPSGLCVTIVEADRPEPLFVWIHTFQHLYRSVRVEPALTFTEWVKLLPEIEARAKPQAEEAKRLREE